MKRSPQSNVDADSDRRTGPGRRRREIQTSAVTSSWNKSITRFRNAGTGNAVVTEEAIVGCYPKKTVLILVNRVNREVRKPVFLRVVFKRITLGMAS